MVGFIKTLFLLLFITITATSCTTSGPALFGKKSPHEQYADKITNAGLNGTALGRQWFAAAEQSLTSPLSVSLPYNETGYFPAEQPKVASLIFMARRGEKLTINVRKKPADFAVYLDVWQWTAEGSKPNFLLSGDTALSVVTYDVEKDGKYMIRLQPELLKGGEYTLSVTAGPSLTFPVTAKVKSSIGSFWGAGRDAGARKHEGIDIFAARGTALVAAADGVITRVGENTLGGKVIFLAPDNKDYSLYYAHLDQQLVQPGENVKTGDTIGLMGNTGNARTTLPHLHFGIYTNAGAIDPLPFVNPAIKTPEKITVSIANVNKWMRNTKTAKLYAGPDASSAEAPALEANTLLKAEAATANWYKVSLPDGKKGFIAGANVTPVSVPVRKARIKSAQPLLDEPADFAARKTILPAGETVSILAVYKDFYFISNAGNTLGWLSKKGL